MNIALNKEEPSSYVALCAVTELYLPLGLTSYEQCNHTVSCPSWQFPWSLLQQHLECSHSIWPWMSMLSLPFLSSLITGTVKKINEKKIH